jgi:hypothetical protein
LAPRAVAPYTPSYGTDRPSLDAGDWGRDAVRRPGADRGVARAGTRTGSPPGSDVCQCLPASLVRPAPGPAAPESADLRPAARRPGRLSTVSSCGGSERPLHDPASRLLVAHLTETLPAALTPQDRAAIVVRVRALVDGLDAVTCLAWAHQIAPDDVPSFGMWAHPERPG